MKRQDKILSAAAVGLIALTAAFLLMIQSSGRKLGKPGVKLVQTPSFNEKGEPLGQMSVYLPDDVRGYRAKAEPILDLEFNFLPKDTTYGRKHYIRESDGFSALTSVVLMGTDRTSIHKPQYCLTGAGWQIHSSEVDTIRIGGAKPYDLKVMKLKTTGDFRPANSPMTKYAGVYVYWFVADGQLTPEHGERMWWMAKDLLTKNTLQRWAYITYFTTCLPGQEEESYAKLKEFIAQTVTEFQLTTGESGPSEMANASQSGDAEVATSSGLR